MLATPPIRFGLYGSNGHQLKDSALAPLGCKITATAAIPPEKLSGYVEAPESILVCESLEELLAIDSIEAVALCSPLRRHQPQDAIAALRAGKHVIAEKPCALDEEELDAILDTAQREGRSFHEMGGTAFAQPYLAMRESVLAGAIGQVVQIIVEKSYPYHKGRPQNEDVDGGLIAQSALHGLRLIEHVTDEKITSVHAIDSTLGNPVTTGDLKMSATLTLRLESGATASIAANYLNPGGTGVWGCDSLKVIGTHGFLESQAETGAARLVPASPPPRPLDTSKPPVSWIECFVREIRGDGGFPITLERELSPTRWAIRARNSAKTEEPQASVR